MKLRWYPWTLFLVMSLISACGRGADEPPSVEILWPRDQHTMALGEVFTVESRTRDDHGISRIELRINGVLVALHEVPKGEKSYRVEQSWLPSGAGAYAITVIAYDSKDQASEPATITITVQPTSTLLSSREKRWDGQRQKPVHKLEYTYYLAPETSSTQKRGKPY